MLKPIMFYEKVNKLYPKYAFKNANIPLYFQICQNMTL